MTILKIITKLFKDPESIDQSTVEFTVTPPEKTKQELFDKAVQEVVNRRLTAQIRKELTEMCYSEEELADTKGAKAAKGKKVARDEIDCHFPKALYYTDYVYGRQYEARFNLDLFIAKLLEGVDD